MVDITIYGAGIFGLSTAFVALKRGATVRVIDPFGVGAGSSGGIIGALAPHTPERWDDKKEFQFQSLIGAEAFWGDVENTGGKATGYGRLGRLQPIADDHTLTLARERIDQAAELWRGRATWSVVSADDHAGWAPKSPTGLLVFDTLSGRMHPRMTCDALAAAVVALGAEIVTDGVEEGVVLHAKGYHGLLELCDEFDLALGNGVKGQAALLQYDARGLPQLFADWTHIVPHVDGTVAIGSTSERYFDVPDQTDEQLDDVIARAVNAFPMLADAPVIERWAGVRPRAKTRAPMLGPYPNRDGHYIANGGFKIGFGMAPKVAEVMCDLMLDGRDDGIPPAFRVAANF